MTIINTNATCGTCLYRDRSNASACKLCMNRDGRPGWEPAEGIQVVYGQDWMGRTTRRVINNSGGAA